MPLLHIFILSVSLVTHVVAVARFLRHTTAHTFPTTRPSLDGDVNEFVYLFVSALHPVHWYVCVHLAIPTTTGSLQYIQSTTADELERTSPPLCNSYRISEPLPQCIQSVQLGRTCNLYQHVLVLVLEQRWKMNHTHIHTVPRVFSVFSTSFHMEIWSNRSLLFQEVDYIFVFHRCALSSVFFVGCAWSGGWEARALSTSLCRQRGRRHSHIERCIRWFGARWTTGFYSISYSAIRRGAWLNGSFSTAFKVVVDARQRQVRFYFVEWPRVHNRFGMKLFGRSVWMLWFQSVFSM